MMLKNVGNIKYLAKQEFNMKKIRFFVKITRIGKDFF